MDEQMKWLVKLQQADTMIVAIERRRRELPLEIDRISQEMQAEQEKFRNAQESLEELTVRRRNRERDLEMEAERIKKSQRRLFEVKTNKEYQALLREIEQAKEANGALEEEILLLMEEMDDLTESLASMKEELDAVEKDLSAKRKEAQEQLDGLKTESSQWRAQRDEAARSVDNGWMAHYEATAKRNNGLAVVRVEQGTCQGCFLSIPPQLYNEILKSGPVSKCPFCMRFIYSDSGSGK